MLCWLGSRPVGRALVGTAALPALLARPDADSMPVLALLQPAAVVPGLLERLEGGRAAGERAAAADSWVAALAATGPTAAAVADGIAALFDAGGASSLPHTRTRIHTHPAVEQRFFLGAKCLRAPADQPTDAVQRGTSQPSSRRGQRPVAHRLARRRRCHGARRTSACPGPPCWRGRLRLRV